MQGISAERVAIEGGRSAALDQALRTVAETDLGAGPKYSSLVMRDLTRVISARAYGRPMLELMHLIRIAEAAGGRHGWPATLFAPPVARPAAFRGVLQKAAACCRAFGTDFLLVEDGVEIAYPDGAFRVTYGRMPFLVALLEFLITALGWRAVDGVLRAWLDDRFALRAAGPHANALSRGVYDHLKEHLPTVQAQRSFRRLIGFLERSRGAGFGLDDVDDEAVLAFWVGAGEAAPEDAADARTFRGVVEQMGRLRSALAAGFARRAVDGAVPIGSDRAAGEVDPDALLGVLEAHDGPDDPLRLLAEPPASQVKFLTGREAEALGLIAALGPQAPALPLSVLRAETFGAAQGRLTQAIRRRAAAAELAALAGLDDCQSYAGRIEQWDRMHHRLHRLALAGLAALLEAGRAEAAVELLAQAPQADLTGLRRCLAPAAGAVEEEPVEEPVEAPVESTVVAFGPRGLAAALSALSDPATVGAAAAAVVAEARAALRGTGRRGFGPDERHAAADGFAAGTPALRAARDMLERVRRAVDGALPEGDRERRFAADGAVFAARLRVLYGVAP